MEPIATSIPATGHTLDDVRCVAFDVYGTLLISAAGDITTTNDISTRLEPFAQVAEMFGFPRGRAHEIAKTYYDRIDRHHTKAHSHGIQHPEVDIRTIWQEVIARVQASTSVDPELVALRYELTAHPVWPMPGARSLLKSLTGDGIRIALVSNAQYYTPLILEALLQESPAQLQLFPCIWSYEVGEAKPSRRPFQSLITVLAEEGITPGQTVYLGNDMINDVVTAQDQELRAVLFAGDARSLREWTDTTTVHGHTPDAVITALDQLRNIMGSP